MVNLIDYTTVVNGRTVIYLEDAKKLVADTIRMVEKRYQDKDKK